MTLVTEIFAYLAVLTQIGLLASLGYFIAKKIGYDLAENEWVDRLKHFISDFSRELALIFAFAATSGSLYLSEFLGWVPCRLCWFQRIFIYPLIIIIGVGIFTRDESMKDYVLPLAMIGATIAFIHSIIQRYEQFQSAGCSITSVSCATEYTFHFGYITIPVLALTAFLAIIVLIWRFD